MEQRAVYFLSDAHFHKKRTPHERRKRHLFTKFVGGLHDASHLYLLGDLFDFWFDYRSVIPRYYMDVLHALQGLAERGTRIVLQGGNHDYWLRSFFEEELGFAVVESPVLVEHQGRKILLHHGDGLQPGDLGYRILKAVIRSRPFIRTVKLLHPDLVNAFAFRFSGTSRRVQQRPLDETVAAMVELAFERFLSRGNDAFLMGHVHYPLHRRRDGRDFVIVGDWEEHFSYVRLHEGRITLEALEEGAGIPEPPAGKAGSRVRGRGRARSGGSHPGRSR
jgi:UDP-2,3-diacylglucosamine hydrolase